MGIDITKLLHHILLAIIIIIIGIIIKSYMIPEQLTNQQNIKMHESFGNIFSQLEPVQLPTITILNSVVDSANKKLNIVRFDTLDNQQKLNDINTRMQKISHSLVGLTATPNTKYPTELTFY